MFAMTRSRMTLLVLLFILLPFTYSAVTYTAGTDGSIVTGASSGASTDPTSCSNNGFCIYFGGPTRFLLNPDEYSYLLWTVPQQILCSCRPDAPRRFSATLSADNDYVGGDYFKVVTCTSAGSGFVCDPDVVYQNNDPLFGGSLKNDDRGETIGGFPQTFDFTTNLSGPNMYIYMEFAALPLLLATETWVQLHSLQLHCEDAIQSCSSSPSASASITPSTSESPSTSPSSSISPTPSITPTSSSSLSPSSTSSVSPTRSRSPTRSATKSPSISASASVSPSITASTSSSRSFSKSNSISRSTSSSKSMSRSLTPTRSPISVTPSASQSHSASHTAASSSSQTASASPSASGSTTSSNSPTTSISPSISSSISESISLTKSPTASKSITKSISATKSATKSISMSNTVSKSISASPSSTRSVSPSKSATASTTTSRTVSASLSSSRSPSETTSVSISVTASLTLSSTVSPTKSLSLSSTMSVTSSKSVSGSKSPSSTHTVTRSTSISPSLSASETPTNTISQSASVSRTNTASLTPTRSVTSSRTSSRTATKSASISKSISLSGTAAPSLSATKTSSNSNSITPTASKSITTSPSASVTISETPSSSPSATASITSSKTSSPSYSVTRTVSSTPSQSNTPSGISRTPSPSTTPLYAVGPDNPAALSVSPTVSPTRTPAVFVSGPKPPDSIEIFVPDLPEGTIETVVNTTKVQIQVPPGNYTLVISNGTDTTDQAVSNIIDLSLFDANGNLIQPPSSVEICFEITNKHRKKDLCLGSFKNGAWQCDDNCLKTEGNMLCGSADHFTNFAILLGGGGEDGDCGSETEGYVTGSAYGDLILVLTLCAFCVCLLVVVGVFGSFGPLKRVIYSNETVRAHNLRRRSETSIASYPNIQWRKQGTCGAWAIAFLLEYWKNPTNSKIVVVEEIIVNFLKIIVTTKTYRNKTVTITGKESLLVDALANQLLTQHQIEKQFSTVGVTCSLLQKYLIQYSDCQIIKFDSKLINEYARLEDLDSWKEICGWLRKGVPIVVAQFWSLDFATWGQLGHVRILVSYDYQKKIVKTLCMWHEEEIYSYAEFLKLWLIPPQNKAVVFNPSARKLDF